jgi:hypothetical protein
MNKKGYHLIILTSKLEIIVLSAKSKEAARAADLLIRGEDREKAEAGNDIKKLIGSWLIDVDTGNVIEAYGLRCKNVDPEEYGYIRMNTLPNGTIDNPPLFY